MTLLEQMARAWLTERRKQPHHPMTIWDHDAIADRCRRLRDGDLLPDGSADREALSVALAVLREEQTPALTGPILPVGNSCLACNRRILAGEPLRCTGGGFIHDMCSLAPPPPCATCGGRGEVHEGDEDLGMDLVPCHACTGPR